MNEADMAYLAKLAERLPHDGAKTKAQHDRDVAAKGRPDTQGFIKPRYASTAGGGLPSSNQ